MVGRFRQLGRDSQLQPVGAVAPCHAAGVFETHSSARGVGRHRLGGPQLLPDPAHAGGWHAVYPVDRDVAELTVDAGHAARASGDWARRGGVRGAARFGLHFFPAWVSNLRGKIDPLKCRLTALDVRDAVLRLVEGRCDLLITYHHDTQPLQLEPERYEMLSLGQEVLAPYVKPAADGTPLFALPGLPSQPLPYLGYAPDAYLGRVVDFQLKESACAIHLERVYETDMAEGLKAMALAGHGIAFLPLSAVLKEVEAKTLVSAGADLEDITLAVRIYRERPGPKVTPKSQANALWEELQLQGTRKPAGRLIASK